MVFIGIFQTLLRHGANPDLRDEDGKTPMDKARERNDEGHREVVHILQSPGIKYCLLLKLLFYVKNNTGTLCEQHANIICCLTIQYVYMLWFKFLPVVIFFQTSSIFLNQFTFFKPVYLSTV